MNNCLIREATLDDIENGLLDIFIEGYRYHQNGRNDVFSNISDEDLKKDLINNFERLSTIVLLEDDKIVGYLSYIIKKHHTKKLDVDQLIISEKYNENALAMYEHIGYVKQRIIYEMKLK